MSKTKIQFKALRECVGLSQVELAAILSVNVRSVKRWESATYTAYNAPTDAWEVLLDLYQLQQDAIHTSADIVKQQAEEFGKAPKAVTLRYFRNQADYDRYGRDEGSHLVANANSRAVANYLVASGLCESVQFVEGNEQG